MSDLEPAGSDTSDTPSARPCAPSAPPRPTAPLAICHGAPTLTLPCSRASGALCAPLTPEQALSAGYRPPGGWSVVAEDWAADRDDRAWAALAAARRLRRDLAQERAEVADLCAELHRQAGEVPGV